MEFFNYEGNNFKHEIKNLDEIAEAIETEVNRESADLDATCVFFFYNAEEKKAYIAVEKAGDFAESAVERWYPEKRDAKDLVYCDQSRLGYFAPEERGNASVKLLAAMAIEDGIEQAK